MRFLLFSILYLLSSLNNMSSGDCTVTPGYLYTDDPGDRVTRAKQNLQAAPLVRLNAASVGARELVPADVRQIVPSVNRTLLINGGFNVWQRGGFPTAGLYNLPTEFGMGSGPSYGADRWYLGRTSDPNMRRITQAAFTPGQTEVAGEPRYYLKWEQLLAQAVPPNSIPTLSQQIEDVRVTAGKTLTISGWVKASKSLTLALRFIQMFDPYTPSALVGDAQNFNIVGSASWVRFSKTFNIPTLAGRTLVDDIFNATYLEMRMEMPANDTYEVDFANIQVEEASAATEFEVIARHDDQARAERYFEVHGGVAGDDVTHVRPCFYFATRKRRAPILALLPGFAGTMTVAAFSTILDTGYYQNANNSVVSAFFMTGDAEFYP